MVSLDIATRLLLSFLRSSWQQMAVNLLPRELLDEILGNNLGKKDLSCASLVCPAWRPSAQRYLLSRVSVIGEGGTQEFEDFRLFLHACPHVRDLVRHLTLRGTRYSKPQISANMVAALLSQLSALRTLHLWQVRFGPSYGSNADQGLYHLEQLKLSRTGGYDSPESVLQLLGLFSNIGELYVRDQIHVAFHGLPSRAANPSEFFRFVHDLPIPCHLSVASVHLQDLKDDTEDFWTEVLRHTRTSQTLQSFVHDSQQPSDFIILSPLRLSSIALQLVHGAGSSVTHMTLGTREDLPFDTLDLLATQYASDAMHGALSSLTSLCSLTLRLHLMQHYRHFPTRATAWRVLLTLLSAFAPRNLHALELHLHTDGGDFLAFPCFDAWWCDEAVDLHALEPQVLAFHDLRTIAFRGAHGLSCDERRRITQELPELARSGLVRFS